MSKYVYVFIVQVCYGRGWEDLTASVLWSEARNNLKDYRNNDPAPSRMISRRVLRTDYDNGNF